jgi:uncharacterized protein (TIGR02284 family)
MTTESDIRAMERIAKIMVDQVRVYRRAAEVEKDRNAASVIKRAAGEREDLLDGLQEHIRALGADPVKHGRGLSGAHAVLVDARAALEAIGCSAIAEVERGEDYLRDEIEKCAAEADVSPRARCVLSGLATRIAATHNEISALKHYAVAMSAMAASPVAGQSAP